MEKLEHIFNREFQYNLKFGDTERRSIYEAIDYIENCVENKERRFNYALFCKTHADWYRIYEEEKPVVAAELETRRIEGLRQKAVIGYHPCGSIFKLKTSKGSFRIKVVEQHSCYGCFFSKVTGRAQAGYPTYGCIYRNSDKNAYCSAEMREDGKAVVYKVIADKK